MTAGVESARVSRPLADEHVEYFERYISRVPDGDIVDQLRAQVADTSRLLVDLSEAQASHRYAPGKWSIREVVGHLTDAERVFVYRAMSFARAAVTPLPGFDENEFVANARFDSRTLPSLAAEFAAVRGATVAFFDALTPEEWVRRGVANSRQMSVRALAWTVAGHELHHRHILETRYLNRTS